VGPGQDGEQPGPGGRRFPQLVVGGERPQRAVLEQVLRVGLVPAAQPARRPIQRVQVLGEDFFEGPYGPLRSIQVGLSLLPGSGRGRRRSWPHCMTPATPKSIIRRTRTR
jgi:hypothetical protein